MVKERGSSGADKPSLRADLEQEVETNLLGFILFKTFSRDIFVTIPSAHARGSERRNILRPDNRVTQMFFENL